LIPRYGLLLTMFDGAPQLDDVFQGFRHGIVPALSDSMILFVIASWICFEVLAIVFLLLEGWLLTMALDGPSILVTIL